MTATFHTSLGKIVCELFPKEAPKTVENFTGLAEGTKAWKNPRTGKAGEGPLYSGTVFHRVIPEYSPRSPAKIFRISTTEDSVFDGSTIPRPAESLAWCPVPATTAA